MTINKYELIWKTLKDYRKSLEDLKFQQWQKHDKLNNLKPSEFRNTMLDAYSLQLEDINVFLDDIEEVRDFIRSDLHLVFTNDMDEFSYLLEKADAYDESYEGKFAIIAAMHKFPFPITFVVWVEKPSNIKTLKGRYLQ